MKVQIKLFLILTFLYRFLLSVTPPPIIVHLTDEEIKNMVSSVEVAKSHLNFMNHTQPVERGVKDITFISKRHPPSERDAVMKIITASRVRMPKFNTKKDFNIFESSIQFEDCDEDDNEYDIIDNELEENEDLNEYENGLITDDSDNEMV